MPLKRGCRIEVGALILKRNGVPTTDLPTFIIPLRGDSLKCEMDSHPSGFRAEDCTLFDCMSEGRSVLSMETTLADNKPYAIHKHYIFHFG